MQVSDSKWYFSPYVLWRRGSLPYQNLIVLIPHKTWAILDQIESIRIARRRLETDLTDLLYKYISFARPKDRAALLNLKRDIYNSRFPAEYSLKIASDQLNASDFVKLSHWLAGLDREVELVEEARICLVDELREARVAVAQLSVREEFLRGIQLSGKSLRRSIRYFGEEYLKSEIETKRLRKTRDTVISFLFRMALKTSPFGSFTEVGAHPYDITPSQTILYSKNKNVFSRVRVSRMLINWIQQQIIALDECKLHLPVWLNNTICQNKDSIEFFTRGEDGTGQMYKQERFIRVPRSHLLSLVLKIIPREGLNLLQISSNLIEFGVNKEKIRPFLERLIEIGLLERGFGLPDQDEHLLLSMSKLLQGIPGQRAAYCAASIEAIARIEAAFPCAPANYREKLLENFGEQLSSLAGSVGVESYPDDTEISHIFEDVGSMGIAASWTQGFLEQKKCELSLVHQLIPLFDSSIIERIGLYEFFLSLYGEEAKVGLLDFYKKFAKLDSEVVTDMMRGVGNDYALRIHELRRKFFCYLGSRYNSSDLVLELDLKWVRDFVSEFPPYLAPSVSASYRLQFFNSTADERGIVINGVGPGHGARYSRFCGLLHNFDRDWSLRTAVKNKVSQDSHIMPQVDLTAVLGVNTNLHPSLSDMEIEYPRCRSFLDAKNVLSLRNIFIKAEPESKRLVLFHGDDETPLNFVPLNFLFPVAGPNLYRFLFALSPFINFHGSFWEMFKASRYCVHDTNIHFPRLILGSLVLERRTWKYSIKSMPNIRTTDFHSMDGLLAADHYWKQLEVPRECFFHVTEQQEFPAANLIWADEMKKWISEFRLTRRRKPHYIDFRNPFLLNIFFKRIRFVSEGIITFQECLPATSSYLGKDGPASAEEYLIELNYKHI